MENRPVHREMTSGIAREWGERGSRFPVVETLAWAAGLIGGLATLVALSATHSFVSWRHRLFVARAGAKRSTLRQISQIVRGQTKQAVASKLGPPRAVSSGSHSAIGRADFWAADAWYYPFDKQAQSALAIQFRNGRAVSVEMIRCGEVE